MKVLLPGPPVSSVSSGSPARSRGARAARAGRSGALALATAVWLLALASSVPGQAPPSDGLRIEGTASDPSGAPVAGAVVLSNAGGEARTGPDGRFVLELEPGAPRSVDALRVTAIATSAGSDRMGSVELGALSPGTTFDAGELTLEASASCDPSWLPTFGAPAALPMTGQSLGVFDDGNGPKLYVGGIHLLRWDGYWTVLGSVNLAWLHGILDLLVFDDGTGPALYAAGAYHSISGLPARGVARWDGSEWSAVGDPIPDTAHPVVYCLAAYDSGSGPELYAGVADDWTVGSIRRWDGTTWQWIGSGVVYDLAVFDDGSGPLLYAGGAFTALLGQVSPNIGRWNGSSWSSVGGGTNGAVRALQVFDDGSGPSLFVGGWFDSAGGMPHSRIARWTGSSWGAPLAGGINGNVRLLEVFDDGGGPVLVAGGDFSAAGGVPANRLAQWDGAGWSPLGSGVSSGLLALGTFDDGVHPKLFATGYFTSAGGQQVGGIGAWDGAGWSAMSEAIDGEVLALALYDSGDGPKLHAGGGFQKAGGADVRRVGRWDGASWSPLGSGMNGAVRALVAHDDGQGPSLFAGGAFTEAGGVPAERVARWDGQAWHSLGAVGGGQTPVVEALAVFDAGQGPELYVTGAFNSAGGVPAGRIARWDGAGWSPLGSGLEGFLAVGHALLVFDDGSGEALYVAGAFTSAGGVAANRIARWDGSTWSGLAAGLTGTALALAGGQLGGEQALFVGGSFGSASGVSAHRVASWNGTGWRALGPGLPHTVRSLALIDLGGGAELYAGGLFTVSGGAPGDHIARWNGASWGAVGGGVAPPPLGTQGQAVEALLAVEDRGAKDLYAGGSFPRMLDSGDAFLARWGCSLAEPGVAYCPGDASSCPCANGGAPGGCANSAGAGALLSGSGSAGVVEDGLLLHVAALPPSQPALLFAGTDPVNGGAGVPFGDGLRCAGGQVQRLGVKLADPGGEVTYGPGLAAAGGIGAGHTARFQVWYRDPVASPCGTGFNLSNGYEVAFH